MGAFISVIINWFALGTVGVLTAMAANELKDKKDLKATYWKNVIASIVAWVTVVLTMIISLLLF